MQTQSKQKRQTQAIYEVLKRGRTHSLSVECQLELFDIMVQPILLYGSNILGFRKNIDCLEKIKIRFCKLLLQLKSSTPNYMMYGELGRFTIDIYIKIRMVSFWARLLLGKETELSYLSYKLVCTLSIAENVLFVRIKFIKELFDETGYSSIWINQDIPNYNWLISGINLRLHDQFKQGCYS